MLRPILLGLCLAAFALPAAAQESPVPDRRIVATTGEDFYGGDIGSIFDTTFQNCHQACQRNPACKALTYNTRAQACFLKSGVERIEAFDGAVSARMVDVPAAVRKRAEARAADLAFLPDFLIGGARELAGTLGGRIAANGSDPAPMRAAARAAERELQWALAAQHYAAATTVSDSSDDWRDLARAWSKVSAANNSERYQLTRDALSAAINAYLRAEGDPARATALSVLAEQLEAADRGRDMIPVLRLSQALAPRRETEERLGYALSNYGFRVTGHTVDSDPAVARMCVEFSDDLAEAGVDYAPYVRVDGQDNPAVDAKGKQLCVDGLEHGRRYVMTVRSGLPSGSGETTGREARIEAYVRDRAPSVRFVGRAYVLPKSAGAAIPVVTVNLTEVEIAIHRVGARGLVPAIQSDYFDQALNDYTEQRIADRIGETIWTGLAEVSGPVNADVTTVLPIGEAIRDAEPGIYAMTARVPGLEEDWRAAPTQWFIVTDLGLAAMSGADGVHGFVRSLSSAEPVGGAKVQLLARNNDVLGEADSDAQGYVRFAPGLTRGKGGAAPALLTVEMAGDFAFINLAEPGFDLSDRGVEGRPAPGPVDIFATTERGVYRPGEVVHLTALARDGTAAAIADLPLTAVLVRPDGVEYHRALLTDQGAGGRAHSVRLGAGVPRGTWQLKLYTDPKGAPASQHTFLVEDFIPERIDFELAAAEGVVRLDAPLTVALTARYLYGAPGADLAVDAEVRLTPTSGLPGFPGFSFGLFDEQANPVSDFLPSMTTDADGKLSFEVPLPESDAVTRPLELTAIVHVTDSSGRPVERVLTRPLATDGLRLGIRPLFEGAVDEGGIARFEIVAVGPDGEQVALDRAGWTLSRINRTWQWYELDGQWNWEAVTSRERIASGNAAVPADSRAVVEASVEWGEYELKVASLDGAYTASSVRFTAGWYGGGSSTDTPDILEIGLDQPAYRIGDTVNVRLKPRHAGKLLLSVVDNRLIDMRMLNVEAGETSAVLTVTEDWGPGAYVTATLIRPMDSAARRNPSRALGLAWAKVDPGPRKLGVTVTTPDEVAPRGPMQATVQVAGVPGDPAYVTIAAVDLGILNLTGFEPPAPDAHYFGQRALGVEMRDLYGRLIDSSLGVPGRLRSGGDAEAKRLAAPPVEELVAFFSGVVSVGPDGTASASFDLPDFNGTVRIMAMAWSARAVGSAYKDVLVRDPVVVSAATPRFLAPGDQSRLLLDIAHAAGPTGDAVLSVLGDGGLSLPADAVGRLVPVTAGIIQQVSLPVTAVEIGDPKLRVRTVTPGGQVLEKVLTLPVRLNDPEVSRQNRISLPPGGRLVVDAATFSGFERGTGRATLAVGPMAQFDAPGLLQALDRYPYGCTEQITSRALPLLYFDQVANALGMTRKADIAERIRTAIGKVLENQTSEGAFGLWRPWSGDLWLDAYVTDFLSRARAAGHEVPDVAFRAAIDNLRSQLSYVGDFQNGGEAIAYALMVLAREGAASIGDLRYYADAKAEALATPMAKAQLGAALAFYGEQARADMMFRLAAKQVLAGRKDSLGWRDDYGSYLRDGAAVLALAAEARTEVIKPSLLIEAIAPSKRRWTSTQEKVWMLMATSALIERDVAGLVVDGQPADGQLVRLFDAATLDGAVVVENRGTTTTEAVLTTYGVPVDPEPAGGMGYRIERAYYTMDGVPVSTESVVQNDRLVAVLTVHSDENRGGRLMVDDPLPAGFEIDNPNLLQAGSIAALDWLQETEVATTEFRSERFLAAVDHHGKGTFQLAYIVRAVSPGRFHHPAAIIEDMYRPDFRAWTGTGTIEVVPQVR